MKISQILDKIDDYQLFVPAFQREYVWKKDNAKDLISSLIKTYPTGTMLTWDTNTPPELKGERKYDQRQGAVKLILDGQQRITTLYILIRGKFPPYYKINEIEHDPRKLFVNVKTLELQYYKKTLMENDPLWVDVTDIFQRKVRSRDIVRKLTENGISIATDDENKIDDNFRAIEQIPDREFVEQTIPIRASLKEAIDIFYIVNASGVNLTDAELALAQISGYWPQARDTFKVKLEALKKDGFVFKLDFIVYVLLGILYNMGSEMKKLHDAENKEALKAAWQLLDTEVLDYVVNLLRSRFYIDHTDEINSVYALIPIIVYVYNKTKENQSLKQEEIQKVIKWFYYSQIRERYISQLAQKLDKDIKVVVASENPFDNLLDAIKAERPLEIVPDEFIGRDVRHSLFNLMKWYFKSKGAICLGTGVGIRKNMGEKYTLEKDHIFAWSILRDRGYSINNRSKYALAQEITNRAILTQVENRDKLAQHAENYLAKVQKNFPTALALQCIPENQELWKDDNFETFLTVRRKVLADELNAFLKNITEITPRDEEISVEDIIINGENSLVEFKSSLRWDLKQGEISKQIEYATLKTLAAFNNTDGGTLLIGINDEGETIGLEHDYDSLDKSDSDGFELHLRGLVKQAFGIEFAARSLGIKFCKIDDKEICVADVKRGDFPVYIEEVSKNGLKQQKFYVRAGNSSQDVPGLKEINDYIKNRFV